MKYLLLASIAVFGLAACSPAPDDAVNVAGKRAPLADCAVTSFGSQIPAQFLLALKSRYLR